MDAKDKIEKLRQVAIAASNLSAKIENQRASIEILQDPAVHLKIIACKSGTSFEHRIQTIGDDATSQVQNDVRQAVLQALHINQSRMLVELEEMLTPIVVPLL